MIARHWLWTALALSAAAVVAPVNAQVAPMTKADSAIMQMRGAIRWASTGQQAYFAQTGAYATTFDALQHYIDGPIDPRVRINFLRATKDGWAAETTHPDLPGKSCVLWLGPAGFGADIKTASEKRTSERPGRAVCDSDPS